MKIGIITFHRAHNYGAILQAQALQLFLNKYTDDVKIVDYYPYYLKKANKVFDFKRALSKKIYKIPIKILLEVINAIIRIQISIKFNRYLNKNIKLTSNKDERDILILGSDQIWNTYITDGFDRVFWCESDKISNQKVVTYAGSFGNLDINKVDILKINNLINKIDYFSIREIDDINKIYEKTNCLARHVCDPTLLTIDFWRNHVNTTNTYNDYILIYRTFIDERVDVLAKKIAKIYDANIIEVSTVPINVLNNSYKIIYGNPIDFLSLIKNAKYVITTSYHGTLFSIIFRTPFYVFAQNNNTNRIKSVLVKLGLDDRLLFDNKSSNYEIPKWNGVEEKLKQFVNDSIDFIEESFKI